MDVKKIVLATAVIIFFAIGCKKEKECDKNDPNSSCYVPPVVNNPTDTIPTGPVDPYAEAKEECAKKSHPDSTYSWNDALKLCEATYIGQPPEPEKEDVIIYYDLASGSSGSNCDGTKDNFYRIVMSRAIIDSLRSLPATGLIIPRVYCSDNRGPPESGVKRMLDSLIIWEPMGLTFRPDSMDVSNFYPNDSIRAQTIKLLLTRKTQYQ